MSTENITSERRPCRWCDQGYTPIPSSVSNAWVHPDSPVGRVVCSQVPERTDTIFQRIQTHFDRTPPQRVVAQVEAILGENEPPPDCGHVPARPDVDLTLCWKCGVEIIPDPDTHLWRPLTATEKLVKHETTRQLRDLFFSVHSSEYQRILFERLENQQAIPAIRLAEAITGRWIVVNGQSEDLAWSGSRWVPHRLGLPAGDAQISNFETRDQAAAYAARQFLGKTADPSPGGECP